MNARWEEVSRAPALPPGVVHVWRADVELLAPSVSVFEALLDDTERARGNAFHFPVDRRRHCVTRGLLRALAGHYVGAAPDALRFGYGPFGKPGIAKEHEVPLRFNVSHSGDFVLLAFSREGEVGVDVERWTSRLGDVERTRLGEAVFSPFERAALAQLSSALEREQGFYSLWSRKEAYLKGTGAGISGGLAHVDVSIGETARLVEDRRDATATTQWDLHDLDVGTGYSAALAFSPRGQVVQQLAVPNHPLELLHESRT